MILAGDVIESAGTRTYLCEMMRHFRRMGIEVHEYCFQFRLRDDLPGGENRIGDFDAPIYLAPGRVLFRYMPRVAYRLFERVVLWRFLRRALRRVGGNDVLIASGCLGAIHLGSGRWPPDSWWLKLGIIEEQGNSGLRYRTRKRIEAMHASRFDNRIVVSEPMGRFIVDQYGRPRGAQLVLPCLVDLDRFPAVADRSELRIRLGFQDRFVLSYVGTAAPWQCVPETVSFFTMLRERMPQAFLWVFTPDQEHFETLLAGLPRECWRVEFRPHSELASVLPAADAGCLLRRRELVNRVASPLKFPEYLACGLPVLVGPEVGGYSGMVREQVLGAVIDPDDPGSWPQAIDAVLAAAQDAEIRRRCRIQAEALSWQNDANRLVEAFGFEGKTGSGK